MEAIVAKGLPRRLPVPVGKALLQGLPLSTFGIFQYRSRSSGNGGQRPAPEAVGCGDVTAGHIQVGVGVDPAGGNIPTGGVQHFLAGGFQQIRAYFHDHSMFHAKISEDDL